MSKYNNAPVSEVILGLTFKSDVFNKENYFLNLIYDLKKEYPKYFIHNALPNEELSGTQRNITAIAQYSGPILYRLKTDNADWLIQLQWNKLYINWIRTDLEKVGNYPGFNILLEKFLDIISRAKKDGIINVQDDVEYVELTYQDRIEWKKYISNLGELDKMMNIKLAPLETEYGGYMPLNILSVKTYEIPEINGFATLNLSTETNKQADQILKTELSLKGKISDDLKFEKWIEKARVIHISFFEKLIKKEILEQWK